MRALLLALLVAIPAPALAQIVPPPPVARPADIPGPADVAARHRYETDRLRARADAAEALRRRQEQETRLTILEQQAARGERSDPPATAPARSPEPVTQPSAMSVRSPDSIATRHRDETDRLRARADAADALRRDQAREARQTVAGLQAGRALPPGPLELAELAEAARADRDEQARRHDQTRQSLSEIDDWLDRPR